MRIETIHGPPNNRLDHLSESSLKSMHVQIFHDDPDMYVVQKPRHNQIAKNVVLGALSYLFLGP